MFRRENEYQTTGMPIDFASCRQSVWLLDIPSCSQIHSIPAYLSNKPQDAEIHQIGIHTRHTWTTSMTKQVCRGSGWPTLHPTQNWEQFKPVVRSQQKTTLAWGNHYTGTRLTRMIRALRHTEGLCWVTEKFLLHIQVWLLGVPPEAGPSSAANDAEWVGGEWGRHGA